MRLTPKTKKKGKEIMKIAKGRKKRRERLALTPIPHLNAKKKGSGKTDMDNNTTKIKGKIPAKYRHIDPTTPEGLEQWREAMDITGRQAAAWLGYTGRTPEYYSSVWSNLKNGTLPITKSTTLLICAYLQGARPPKHLSDPFGGN